MSTFNPSGVINFFIFFIFYFFIQLDRWSQDLNADFTLKDWLFGSVKLTKNSDPGKYSYSGCSIRFDSRFY